MAFLYFPQLCLNLRGVWAGSTGHHCTPLRCPTRCSERRLPMDQSQFIRHRVQPRVSKTFQPWHWFKNINPQQIARVCCRSEVPVPGGGAQWGNVSSFMGQGLGSSSVLTAQQLNITLVRYFLGTELGLHLTTWENCLIGNTAINNKSPNCTSVLK